MNELLTKLPDLNKNIGLTISSLNIFHKSLREIKDKLAGGSPGYSCTPITFLDKYPKKLQIPDSDFIDKEIYDFLQTSNGFYQQYNINIGERIFTIHFYLPSENKNTKDNNILNYFQECFNKIYFWLNFILPYVKKDSCSLRSTIYLLLTPFKKHLPSHNEPITTSHANSAFTTSCAPETEVYIFRHEEWFKVLLHESFHCLGLDFSHYNNFEAEKRIFKQFRVQNKNGIRVYEAYVEIWAEVLNIVLVSFFKTKDKSDFLILFKHLLNKELSFSLFQCTKILKHLNFSYDEISDCKCSVVKYKETCNLTAYYFLKFILFFNLRQFESWCKRHNLTLFQFDKNYIIDFVDFIIKRANTPQLEKCMKKMDIFYERAKLPQVAKKTMKMTIIN